jgi:diguanylate cyclase (GGDEF)-like protein
LLGVLLATGAPAGLLLLRAILDGRVPDASFIAREIAANAVLYAYLACSTAIAFAVTGWVLGRKVDELSATASTDPLTGLVNRRAFEDRLALELARTARYGSPLALLLADLDGLKPLNDKLGHEAGDQALISIAATLQASCRETDLVARVGGDEFVVLAPSTTRDEAMDLAQRIRETLHGPTRGQERIFTLSIGVAAIEGRRSVSAAELLAAADKALYDAKGAGRDRASASDAPWFRRALPNAV